MNAKNYTREQIEKAVHNSTSAAEACRKLGCCGSTFFRWATQYGLYFTNQSGKGTSRRRKYKTADDVFKEGNVPSGTLVSYLKQEREWKCECCGLTEWNGKKLPLEVHHIDGNHKNNVRTNLQILCPNCHSLTETWRSRNVRGTNKYVPRVTDQELLKALQSSPNIRQALQKVGLAEGANYYRAKKLLSKVEAASVVK